VFVLWFGVGGGGGGLYKRFFYFESFVYGSIILSLLPPTCIGPTVAILSHDCWEIYEPPLTSLLYVLHRTILVIN